MCGGEGSRLEAPSEKPLFPVAGVPMVDRVRGALAESRLETIYAAVSSNAPETGAHLESTLEDRDALRVVETSGEGYVTDLLSLLERPEIEPPLLTVAADLPLLSGAVIDRVLDRQGDDPTSRTVCVPTSLKRRLGVSIDTTLESREYLAPTGVNVVGTTDESMIDVSYDTRLAINVNRRTDADRAAEFLEGGDR